MTLEHRLQHAGRELREVPIDVPPLGTRAAAPHRPRVHALSASMLLPLLFVVAGLFAIGAARGPDAVRSDVPTSPATVPSVVDAPTAERVGTATTPVVSTGPDTIATKVGNRRARRDPAATSTGPRSGTADLGRYQPV